MMKNVPLLVVFLAACGSNPPGVQLADGGASTDAATSPTGADLAEAAPRDFAVQPDAAQTVTSGDGFGEARTACINEINRLRGTQGLPPYAIVNTDAVNMCVDAQASSDEASNAPHAAWAMGSSCNGNGQNECEGYGTDAAGIVACLDAMWAEQNQPNCAGCVGCTQFGGNCANCDFYGQNGQTCGHYVNMSATYFTQVACGFSLHGTWSAQNYFQ